ncbi:hypothetical protein KFE25_013952 [Diacronema lutheri]|uniref:F-box domain-containing protein n=1 Tax=Diacronema lutheri TaxID=2081491 RepID=A0A8J6CBX2_DIALT|nr:hypothetical protein KFE25_013952 [Diacronema lutheri]
MAVTNFADLPFDALLEIALRAVEPPRTAGVAHFARACRATAAVSRAPEFWQLMLGRLALRGPTAGDGGAEASALRGSFVAERRRARARWLAALTDARREEGVPVGRSEATWSVQAFRKLARRLGASWRAHGVGAADTAASDEAISPAVTDARLAELAGWACALGCPLAAACAITLLHEASAKGAPADRSVGTVLDEARGTLSLDAERVRVVWWSLGGKDLRGYRCRDDMTSVSLSLAELAAGTCTASVPADSRVDVRADVRDDAPADGGSVGADSCSARAALALAVLERGVKYEVRRVLLEVGHTPALPAAAGSVADGGDG